MNKQFILAAVFSWLHLSTVPALADQQDAKQLNELLTVVHTFQAQFEQRVLDEKSQKIQGFAGMIRVKKPGKLFWQANAPMLQTVITRGEKLWYYDADLEQLTIQPFKGEISHTPALLLGGEVDKLQDSFEITRLSTNDPKQPKGQSELQKFDLRPKNKDSLFEVLTVTFMDGQIISLDMHDSLQQRTEILFTDIVINAPVDDDIFDFIPPEGTDVLVNE